MMKIHGVLWVLLTIGLSNCNSEPHNNEQLLTKIRMVVTPVRTMTHGYRVLNLDSLTNFAWDSVYYFTGDVEEHGISNIIGFSWHGPRVPEFCKRLLFVYKKQVVTFVDFPKYAGVDDLRDWPIPIQMQDCTNSAKVGRIVCERHRAKFAVSRYCDKYGLVYSFIPIDCIKYYQNTLNKGCPEVTAKALADSAAARLAR